MDRTSLSRAVRSCIASCPLDGFLEIPSLLEQGVKGVELLP